jgi:calcium/calmodulin-dependent protein kinase kinase 2
MTLRSDGQFHTGTRPSNSRIHMLVLDMLSALTYIHGLHIVHRDIKPDNIIEMSDGRYVLSDFGSARRLGPDGMLRESPATLAFYPPDVCLLEDGKFYNGFQADLWALGVSVWIVKYGHLPYGDESVSGSVSAILDSITSFRVDHLLIDEKDPFLRHVFPSLLNPDPSIRSTVQHQPFIT